MHCLYFIVLAKEEDSTSLDARKDAQSTLIQENFCQEGFFGGGKGDWFVIGGRWSGVFSWTLLGLNPMKKKGFKKSWKKAGIKTPIPYTRSVHEYDGYEDDAMILDKKLWEALVKKYPDVELYDADNYDERFLRNFEEKELLGRWIIAIDYHG